MVCPLEHGDNPRALASGLSPRTCGQTWYNYFIPPISDYEIFRAKVSKIGINILFNLQNAVFAASETALAAAGSGIPIL